MVNPEEASSILAPPPKELILETESALRDFRISVKYLASSLTPEENLGSVYLACSMSLRALKIFTIFFSKLSLDVTTLMVSNKIMMIIPNVLTLNSILSFLQDLLAHYFHHF